jgi:hypothetical protein
MKKSITLLSVTLFLAMAAAGGVFLLNNNVLSPTPEQVVCTRLTEVCDVDGDGWSQCTEDVGEWMKTNPEDTANLATCVTDADNCAGVSGCLAGAGLRSIGGGVGDFIKGMGKALGLGR